MPRQYDTGRVGLIGGLGRACYRHRVITLVVWIAGVAGLIALWTQFGAAASSNFTGYDPGQAILDQHFPRQSGDALTLAITSARGITSPAVRGQVTGALRPFAAAPHVTSVSDPYTTPGHVSADGHVAFATVQFSLPSASIPGGEVTSLMNDARAASAHGVTFSLGGDLVDAAETPEGGPTEGIGVTAAAIVLLIAFGSVLAMGLPVATALFGIGAGLSLIALAGHLVPAPSFSPIIAGLIGLGVGVDYALFIVTRFREEMRGVPGGRPSGLAQRDGLEPEAAATAAMRTAGRSVLTAGTTVVIGTFGLFVVRQPMMNGIAVACAATVAMTVLAALTLLPALLGFTGTRLAKPSRFGRRGRRAPTRVASAQGSATQRPTTRGPAAERWAGVVQRHPVIAAVTSAAVIAVLAAPALGMKLNMPDESTQGRATMGYASYSAMARGFGPGFDAPLIIAASLRTPATSTARLAAAVTRTPGVARVTPMTESRDGKAAMMIAYPATGEQNPATNTLVNRITSTVIPQATSGTGIRAFVTGPNAANVTFANQISQRLPLLIAIVVALAMVLLLVVFGRWSSRSRQR
jgi:RND superfamily putative drug exporter